MHEDDVVDLVYIDGDHSYEGKLSYTRSLPLRGCGYIESSVDSKVPVECVPKSEHFCIINQRP